MSCSVSHRHGSDLVLLWLQCRAADSTPSLGTSICRRHGPKKKKKKKDSAVWILCFKRVKGENASDAHQKTWYILDTKRMFADKGQFCKCQLVIKHLKIKKKVSDLQEFNPIYRVSLKTRNIKRICTCFKSLWISRISSTNQVFGDWGGQYQNKLIL